MLQFIIALLIVASSLSAAAQSPEWVSHLQGAYNDTGRRLCRDSDDNIYLTGRFSSGTINGEPIATGDAYDIYLAKFSSAGDLVWSSLVGGDHPDPFSGGESGYYVVYDSLSNSIYLGGAYSSSNGTASFGTIQVGGAGGFLAKYDTAGECLWVRTTANCYATSISVDEEGSIYVHSWDYNVPYQSVYNGPPTVTLPNGPSIGKYTPAGDLLWAKSLGSNFTAQVIVRNGVMHLMGNAEITGAILLEQALTDTAGEFGFLARLDTSLTNILFLKEFVSSVRSIFNNTVITTNDHYIIAGSVRGELITGVDTMSGPVDESRSFAMRLEQDGAVIWTYTNDANTNATFSTMAPDSSLYLALNFSDSFDLPFGTLTANSQYNFVVIRLDQNGIPVGAVSNGPIDYARVNVQATSDNGVVVVSEFTGRIDFDSSQTISGGQDVFVAKYGPLITSIEPKTSLEGQLLIYANPNDGTCTIELPESVLFTEGLILKISDAEGRLVQSIPIKRTEEKISLDIRAQAKGMYPVVITDGKQRYSGTIVFQ